MDTIDQINGRHASNLYRYGTGTLNKIIKELLASGDKLAGQIFMLLEDMTEVERQAFIAGSYKTKRAIAVKKAVVLARESFSSGFSCVVK